MAKVVTKAVERRIFTTDPADIAAAVLACSGFSNRCIQERTGTNQQGRVLSGSMISYRMKWLAPNQRLRQLARDGKTPESQVMLKAAYPEVERMVLGRVKKASK